MLNRYIVFEVEQFNDISQYGENDELIVAFLFWLASHLEIQLKDKLSNVKFGVIKLVYKSLSAYPVLAIYSDTIQYFDENYQLIANTCDQIIQQKKISDFIEFLGKNEEDWSKLTVKIMED